MEGIHIITPEKITKRDFRQAKNAKEKNESQISKLQQQILTLDDRFDNRQEEIERLLALNKEDIKKIKELRNKVQEILNINKEIDEKVIEGYENTQAEL